MSADAVRLYINQLILCVYCSMDPERVFFPSLDMWSMEKDLEGTLN